MANRRIVLGMMEAPLPFGHTTGRWLSVLLRGLVKRGFDVTAFAAFASESERAGCRSMFPEPAYDLRLFPRPRRPGLRAKLDTLRRPMSYTLSAEMIAAFEHEARAADIVHLESTWSGWLGENCDRARTLLCIHNLYAIDLDPGEGGVRGRLEAEWLVRAERAMLRRYPNLTALTPELAAAARRIAPRSRVDIAPLALDPSLYPVSHDRESVVLLVGSMRWRPTYAAAVRLIERLWPALRREVPHARLLIAGWGAAEMLRQYRGVEGLDLRSDVPSVQDLFARSGVLLYAPGAGSGMKIKVLEAFAQGLPVVTSAPGVEGIPARDGVHAEIAETDEELIRRTAALLRDPANAVGMARAARALIEGPCGPEAALDRVERLHDEAVAGQRRAA